MGRAGVVLAVSGIALGLLYLVTATTSLSMGTIARPGAAVFPIFIVAPLLLLSSLVVFIQQIKAKKSQTVVDWPDKRGLVRILLIMGFCLCFVFLLEYLGYVLVSGFLAYGIMHALGGQRWQTRVVISIGYAVSAYVLFSILLGVHLPIGFWDL